MREKILALIPARMGSSRFPGKPMASLLGIPMVGHVYKKVSKSNLLSLTAVATCDQEIYDYIVSIGGNAVMTDVMHERASDRCAEALVSLEYETKQKYDIVVMAQGDEPMIHPAMLEEAVQPMLEDKSIKVTNLMSEITEATEFEDHNCIKVVCDLQKNALYFSREPIPTRAKTNAISMNKQVCVIPFRRDFLVDYTKMPPTPLEIAESIDMLRILEHGEKIRMVPTRYKSYAVDTEADRLRVEKLMQLENHCA